MSFNFVADSCVGIRNYKISQLHILYFDVDWQMYPNLALRYYTLILFILHRAHLLVFSVNDAFHYELNIQPCTFINEYFVCF